MKIGAAGDKIIHLMNQIIAGVRTIKIYCWEKRLFTVIESLVSVIAGMYMLLSLMWEIVKSITNPVFILS